MLWYYCSHLSLSHICLIRLWVCRRTGWITVSFGWGRSQVFIYSAWVLAGIVAPSPPPFLPFWAGVFRGIPLRTSRKLRLNGVKAVFLVATAVSRWWASLLSPLFSFFSSVGASIPTIMPDVRLRKSELETYLKQRWQITGTWQRWQIINHILKNKSLTMFSFSLPPLIASLFPLWVSCQAHEWQKAF